MLHTLYHYVISGKPLSLSLSLSLSLCFNSQFPIGPGLAGTRMSPFWILLELRMTEVVVTTGAVRRAKLQPKCHHQQTNTQFFTGRMPFLSPNQQCQSTEGKWGKPVVSYIVCNIRLECIGLREFTTASLFLELLSPVSFLMVIIIQLHYFHADFLRISSLDRFKKYVLAALASRDVFDNFTLTLTTVLDC